MMDTKKYVPDQPFFELTTDNFQTRCVSPSGLLAQYYSFTVTPEKDKHIVAVPDGTVDIIFRCNENNPYALVYGSVLKGKEIHFEKDALYFGVRFLPGAAEQILDCPLDLFTEEKVSIGDIQNNTGELIERICMADSFEQRISLFEEYQSEYVCKETTSTPLVHEILNRINRTNGDMKIQALSDELGYSSRYVNKVFKKHVGISPKLYERIVRFQSCLGKIRHSCLTDYTELAYDSGYYDQAHFINEFKEFSLSTPTQLFCP